MITSIGIGLVHPSRSIVVFWVLCKVKSVLSSTKEETNMTTLYFENGSYVHIKKRNESWVARI